MNNDKQHSFDELKELIAKRLSIEEFLDLLGYTMFDLVERLEQEIEENWDELEDAVR